MDKKVSVVLAAFDGEKYIKSQILSILPQLRNQDELIVTLDPGTDKTESEVLNIHDSRIRLLKGPGQGILKNVENGLKSATGDYIFLSDQDDVWHPQKVRKVLEQLNQKDTLLVLHDCRLVDEALNELEPSYFRYHGTNRGFFNNLIRNSFIGCCMAFNRSLLNAALPFPSQLPMHDQWLGLVAEKKGNVVYLPEPLLDYRRHNNNQSSLQHAGILTMIQWRIWLIRALKERKLL